MRKAGNKMSAYTMPGEKKSKHLRQRRQKKMTKKSSKKKMGY